MTRYILTTASAALLAGASALPALSDDHVNLDSMSCADFRALSEQEQMDVAVMAIAEQQGGGESMRESATAETPTTEETTEAEADASADTTVVDNEGTATATDGGDDVERESVMEADLEALMRACDRNLNAMVLEAAAGMDTSR